MPISKADLFGTAGSFVCEPKCTEEELPELRYCPAQAFGQEAVL